MPNLWQLADLATPMAIRVAATLRVADRLEAGPRSAAELAEASGARAEVLERVLRHLDTVGVLRRDDSGRYTLTELGGGLRTMGGVLDAGLAVGRAELSLFGLLGTVRTGEPCYPAHYGRPFWADIRADPALSASYDEQMGADAQEWAQEVVPAYDWGALGHLVDVGGGDGTLLAGVLRACPGLRGTVVELPETVETARRRLADAGLTDRADAVAGDFFTRLPPGAGGYLLCAVLHDWDDDSARRILACCAEAAAPDSRILVVEKPYSGGAIARTGMDLRMLAWFGGRERDVAEYEALAADAGLETRSVRQVGGIALIELAKRQS